MSPDRHDQRGLDSQEWSAQEQLLVRFEAAWKTGQPPDIDAYLTFDSPHRFRLLVELVYLDLEIRLNRKETIRVETYIDRFPELGRPEIVVKLASREFALRQRTDPGVTLEEYCQRFPQYAELLAQAAEDSQGTEATVHGPAVARLDFVPAPTGKEERYRLKRFHARGGLGEVHVALDTELGRLVALKRIQPHHADDAESRQRFLREASITARLEHPGIVPVHGLTWDEVGQPNYAMRFIAGESLQDALRRFHDERRKPGAQAAVARPLLNRFVTVCNTIAYAHSKGVVHRDLKPANIMLGEYGETLVVDWGLAKVASEAMFESKESERSEATPEPLPSLPAAAPATVQGQALGTPAYMSPEQAEGRWDVVGPASDIFSLGATLYAVLTGRAPFTGKDVMQVLSNVCAGRFKPPRQVQGQVPPALEAICVKAMSLRPADRYPSALALAEDVEHWLADEAVAAYRAPWPARLGRWTRRHRTLATAAGVLLGMAVLALVAITWLTEQSRQEIAEKQEATEKAEKKALRLAADEQAQRRLAVERLANGFVLRAQPLLEQGDLLAGLPWLAASVRETTGVSPDRERVHRLHLATVLERCPRPVQVWFHDHAVTRAAWSRDDRQVVTVSGRDVQVWDPATGRRIAGPLVHDQAVDIAQFSRDGKRVLTTTRGFSSQDVVRARVWDVTTSKALAAPFSARAKHIWNAELSPDGRRVLTVGVEPRGMGQSKKYTADEFIAANNDRQGTVALTDADTGKPLVLPIKINGPVRHAELSPDGNLLLTVSKRFSHRNGSNVFKGEVQVWDLAGGREALKAIALEGRDMHAHFRDAGRRIVTFSQYPSVVRVWELATGREVLPPLDLGDSFVDISAISPDANQVIVAGSLWLLNNFKHHSISLPDMGRQAGYSRDGTRLLTWDESRPPRLWQNDKALTPPLHHHKEVNHAELSGDARFLLTASSDGTARLIDLATQETAPLPLDHPGTLVQHAEFDLDGARVVTASYRSLDQGKRHEGEARLYEVETGKLLLPPLLHPWSVTQATFSPDGRLVLAVNGSVDVYPQSTEPGRAQVWTSGKPAAAPMVHKRWVTQAIFSPDGRRVATAGLDGTAGIWDAVTGRPLVESLRHDQPVRHIALLADGKTLLTASGSFDTRVKSGKLRVWDVDSGREKMPALAHPDAVLQVAVSRDGQRAATACRDGRARLWWLASGKQIAALAHRGSVELASFDAPGARVLTASSDESARLGCSHRTAAYRADETRWHAPLRRLQSGRPARRDDRLRLQRPAVGRRDRPAPACGQEVSRDCAARCLRTFRPPARGRTLRRQRRHLDTSR